MGSAVNDTGGRAEGASPLHSGAGSPGACPCGSRGPTGQGAPRTEDGRVPLQQEVGSAC